MMSQHVNSDQLKLHHQMLRGVDQEEMFFSLEGESIARKDINHSHFAQNHTSNHAPKWRDGDEFTPVYNFEVSSTHTYIANGVRVHNDSTLSFVNEENGEIVGGSVANDGEISIITRSADGGTWTITRTGFDPDTGTTSVTKEYSYLDERGAGMNSFVLVQTESWGEDENGNQVYLGVTIDSINLAGDELGNTNLANGLTPYLSSAIGLSSDLENLLGGTVIETVLQNLIQIGGNTIHHTLLAPRTNGFVLQEITEAALEDFDTEIAVNLADNAISLVNQLIMAEIYEIVDLGDNLIGDVAGSLLSQGVDYFISQGVSQVLEIEGIFDAEEVVKFANPTALIATTLFNEIVPENTTVEGSISNLVASSFAQAFGTPGVVSNLLSFAGLTPALGPLVVGAAVGALVDLVVDALKNPEAYIDLDFDAQSGNFILTNLRSEDGGVREIAEQLGTSAHTYLSQFVEALASNSHNYEAIGPTSIGYKEENYQDGAGVRRGMGTEGASTDTVFATLLEVLKQIRVADGDLKVAKALDLENFASNTAGMSTEEAFSYLYSRMRVAQDYQYYLENTNAVNAVLTAAPNSPEAAGWLATILQASDMGLADDFIATGDSLDNVFFAGDGEDNISGGDGNDTIKTYGGNDILDGGAGDDTLDGGFGADAIEGGAGQDRVAFTSATLGVGLDLSLGVGLFGDAEGDTYSSIEDVLGSQHADLIRGDDGANVLEGSGGDDQLFGRAGQDIIHGGSGDDFIDGGADQDMLFGNEGDDFFIWGGGVDTFDGGEGLDTVSLTELTEAITVNLSATNDHVITFSDGTQYSSFISIESIRGSSANDTYVGDNGANYLNGGLGDDFLDGGQGADTYFYELGDGNDTISESIGIIGGKDVLSFGEGISLEDITATRDGFDLILTVAGTGETITIINQHFRFNIGGSPHQIEEFHFADGTVVTPDYWRAQELENQITAGNETIIGYDYEDTLRGGQGTDRLVGGGDSDTYLFNAGDGNDTVFDYQTMVSLGNEDLVIFGNGLSSTDVTLSRDGDDLIFTFDTGDTLTVEDQFRHQTLYVVESFQFSDGVVWTENDIEDLILIHANTPGDDIIVGFNRDDILAGGAGNDRLEGQGGDDIYLFNLGDGNDIVYDYQTTSLMTSDDTVRFGEGLTSTNVTVRANGPDLIFTFDTGDTLTVESQLAHTSLWLVETFEFSDGVIWSSDQARVAGLTGGDGDDTITGHDYDDTIIGGAGDDTLIGGRGNDILQGGIGNDTIDGGVGDDAHYGGDGDDLVIASSGIDSFDGGAGVDTIDFSYSVTSGWTFDMLAGTASIGSIIETMVDFENLIGSGGSDTIFGNAADNILIGGDWHDTIRGGDGNDTIHGDHGDDTIFGEDGDDLIFASIGADSFDGGAGVDTIDFSYSNANWTLDLSAGTASTGSITETMVNFENAIGGRGNDTIFGNAADNQLDGGTGDDTFLGSGGSDIIRGGDGAGEYNQVNYTGYAADYAITINTDGSISVLKPDGNVDTLYDIDGFYFETEAQWYSSDNLPGVTLNGSAGNDTLIGTAGDDEIFGLDGDDTFLGSGGSDIIRGGDGASEYNQVNYTGFAADYAFTLNADGSINVLKPDGNTDTLYDIDGFYFETEAQWYDFDSLPGATLNGSAGNDTLIGTAGDDEIFGLDGDDTILSSGGSDIIRGGDGVTEYNQVNYAGAVADYTFAANPDGSVTVTKPGAETDTLFDIDGIYFEGSAQWYDINTLISPPPAQSSSAKAAPEFDTFSTVKLGPIDQLDPFLDSLLTGDTVGLKGITQLPLEPVKQGPSSEYDWVQALNEGGNVVTPPRMEVPEFETPWLLASDGDAVLSHTDWDMVA